MTSTTPTKSTGRALIDALAEVAGPSEPTQAQLDRFAAAYHAHPGDSRRSAPPAQRPRPQRRR